MTAWDAGRMGIAAKIKALRDAGFSNSEIIEAKKANLVDELVGKEVQRGK